MASMRRLPHKDVGGPEPVPKSAAKQRGGGGSRRFGGAVVLAAFVAALMAAEAWTSSRLPETADGRFDADAALGHVSKLASQPRTIGSKANEVDAPAYLEVTLRAIALKAGTPVEVELQRSGRGAFEHAHFLGGVTSAYASVTNVLARVQGADAKLGAVLVNAHFDSVDSGGGAFDDAVGCGVMLEVLRAMAMQQPHRTVIFLFNGAEEMHQLGAHAFATQHRWAAEVEFVANLEAMGAGGRELVFQCGSSDVARILAATRARRTIRGSIIASELFDAVLWRAAATDYRTFLTFLPRALEKKRVTGFDTAFIDDGYAYHTSHDALRPGSIGSVRHLGGNLLAILDVWASSLSVELLESDPADEHGYVFFDLFGLWFIYYDARFAAALHVAAAMIALVVSRRLLASGSRVVRKAAHTLAAVLAAAAACFCLGVVLALIAPMRWYRHGIPAAVLLYSPLALCVYADLIARWPSNEAVDAPGDVAPSAFSKRAAGPLALWSVLLLTAAAGRVGSGYPALFFVVGLLIALGLDSLVDAPTSALMAANALPFLLWLQVSHTILTMLVPLLGRVGSALPMDPAVGLVVGLLTALGATVFIGVHPAFEPAPDGIVAKAHESSEALLPAEAAPSLPADAGPGGTGAEARRRKAVQYGLLVVCTALAAGLGFGSYSPDIPKRLTVQHISRKFYHLEPEGALELGRKDAGVWVLAMDGRGLAPLVDAETWPPAFDDQRGDTPALLSRAARLSHLRSHVVQCDHLGPECFLDWPYFFPFSDIIRGDARTIAAADPARRGRLPAAAHGRVRALRLRRHARTGGAGDGVDERRVRVALRRGARHPRAAPSPAGAARLGHWRLLGMVRFGTHLCPHPSARPRGGASRGPEERQRQSRIYRAFAPAEDAETVT
ncbi:hypothetical protein M885DRAFT_24557 [Pelagophyceae sp. CCMP2097]|nr:hypothetical protein M885DRAFT_24557 [Pelagophyceae sp. CCMP2097]